jgi:hypothetical protein
VTLDFGEARRGEERACHSGSFGRGSAEAEMDLLLFDRWIQLEVRFTAPGSASSVSVLFLSWELSSSSVARQASAQPAHPGSNPHLAVISQGGANKPGYHPSVHPRGESHPT